MAASGACAAPPQPVYVTGSVTTNDCVKFSSVVSVTDSGLACGAAGSNPFPIGPAQIGAGSGTPPITTYCANSAGEGSLCMRTDLGYLYTQWDPPSAIPTRVQETAVIATYAMTLGSAPTLGNYLLAFGYSSAAIPTVAAGWTSISTHTDGGAGVNAVLAYHLVVPGDTTSQTPFTTAGSCFGAAVIEVSGLDMSNFANSLQANAYGENASGATASVSFSPTTTRANTLGVAFSGAERNGGCGFSLSVPTISAGWTNTVTVNGTTANNSATLVSSQAFPSNGSTASATVSNSSAGGARMTAAEVLLQPSTDTLTTGFQPVSYLTTVKNAGSTITTNARSINCSTGTSCSADADSNITLTAGQSANTIPIASLAQIGADTWLGNQSGSTANVAASSWPSCSGASNAIIYNTTTHTMGCNTIAAGVGVTGTPTAGHCAEWFSSSVVEDSGAACGGGGGGSTLVAPQGRLTLITATPVMTSDQSAKSTVYYDCYAGNNVPYYNGSADQLDTISSCEVSMTMATSSTGVTNSSGVFDVWWVHGGTNRICVATNGSGGGWASDTGGSNTARGTGYSQVHNTRGYYTNVNSITHCYNGSTDYGSVSADQATLLGTLYTTAAGQTTFTMLPAAAAGGTNNCLCLWNAYNRVHMSSMSRDSTASWTYGTATWRAEDAAATGSGLNNRVTVVDGLGLSSITCAAQGTATNAATGAIGCDLDSTSNAPQVNGQMSSSSGIAYQDTEHDRFAPQIGQHYLQQVEAAAGTITFLGAQTSPTRQSNALVVEIDN